MALIQCAAIRELHAGRGPSVTWNNTVWIASMESIYPAECITKPKGMICMICMMIVQCGNKIALFRYHITQESHVFVFQRN